MIGKLKSVLTDPKNIKFAAFLSSLAAGFKVAEHDTELSLAGWLEWSFLSLAAGEQHPLLPATPKSRETAVSR